MVNIEAFEKMLSNILSERGFEYNKFKEEFNSYQGKDQASYIQKVFREDISVLLNNDNIVSYMKETFLPADYKELTSQTLNLLMEVLQPSAVDEAPINNGPTAVDDSLVIFDQGWGNPILNVIGNDYDIDGDSINVISIDWISINGNMIDSADIPSYAMLFFGNELFFDTSQS